ncbi:MAG: mannose-1-phosphate guanylyltransferase/mannose-6-phosphate isomerase [Legionella sp.]|nr:MAG: mannose-1-phosphate guanylyltransferase/mannose-6-phosphate isomerase [Legionella sp.]
MILPVIMVGGTGSRLWPLSRELYPKQFLNIQGPDSMLQATVKRLQGLDCQDPLLICNEEHRFIVNEQLNQINQAYSDIILEPIGRNTAPAIALAALKAIQNEQDPLLLVLAADHVVSDIEAFHDAIRRATPYAEQGKLVAFGIVPTHPEIGYGYIKALKTEANGYRISEFVEKPNKELAQTYLDSGDYYWNSGMFMFRASLYLEELKKYQEEIYTHCFKALKGMKQNREFTTIDRDAFMACPTDSIDYAVMEQTENAVVVPMNAGWSDIGSWAALWDSFEKNEQSNVQQGDVISLDTKDCFIRSDEKLVVTIGLDNIVVVDTKDAILVAAKDKVQDVKKVVEILKETGRSEAKLHREVYRPWGKYDSIDHGARYQVKRITVKPGEKLSIQMHHHRAEHWIVVSGTARVTNGDKTYLLTENQSTYIPLGVVHSLENPGKVPLEIIEVQSGSYLGEDDIIRFEDRYGRTLVDKLEDKVEVTE